MANCASGAGEQQQQEAAYEAALEQRRAEVEAERLRRDLEQLRLVTALSRMSDQPPEPPSAGAGR